MVDPLETPEGQRIVEAMARELDPDAFSVKSSGPVTEALRRRARDNARRLLRAALSVTGECKTCGNRPVAAWCEFDGTGEGCTRVTEFTGGHASGVVRWKTRTYDGGWIGDEEFSPGDTILRREDGSYSVGSYKAWAQRLTKVVGCPDPNHGEPLLVLREQQEPHDAELKRMMRGRFPARVGESTVALSDLPEENDD